MVDLINHLFCNAVFGRIARLAAWHAILPSVSVRVVDSINTGANNLTVVVWATKFAGWWRGTVEAGFDNQIGKLLFGQREGKPAPHRILSVVSIQSVEGRLPGRQPPISVAAVRQPISFGRVAAAGFGGALLKAAHPNGFFCAAIAAAQIKILIFLLLLREGNDGKEPVFAADLARNRRLSDHGAIIPQFDRWHIPPEITSRRNGEREQFKGTAFEARIA